MDIFIPKFQFEIRFDPILNFANVIKEVVSPYTRISSRLQILKENSVNERLSFYFDNDFYEITILWDRLFIQVQGQFESLFENNSIIEEPFMSMLDKIQKIPTFNCLKNNLINIVFVKPSESTKEEIITRFMRTYIKDETLSILKDANDFAIVLQHNSADIEERITIGPYLGLADLNKREIFPTLPSISSVSELYGEMLEINLFSKSSSISFKDFKSKCNHIIEIKNNFWN